jgi:hypothetical protein
MVKNGGMRVSTLISSLILTTTVIACDNNVQKASEELSAPSFGISGTGSNIVASNFYVLATADGTVDSTTNTIIADFADPDTPLKVYADAYWDQMNSGSCSSLANLTAAVGGGGGNLVVTQLSATGCTDQAVIGVLLDTTEVWDDAGVDGNLIVSFSVIVDLAPMVTSPATGNTAVDGSGATNGSTGVFSIAGDNSIVVAFSKDLTGGNLNATLTGCAATLGTPNIVAGSSGLTVAWPVSGFSGFSSGTTCTMNISGLTDSVNNPEDASDPNLSMIVTFN